MLKIDSSSMGGMSISVIVSGRFRLGFGTAELAGMSKFPGFPGRKAYCRLDYNLVIIGDEQLPSLF